MMAKNGDHANLPATPSETLKSAQGLDIARNEKRRKRRRNIKLRQNRTLLQTIPGPLQGLRIPPKWTSISTLRTILR